MKKQNKKQKSKETEGKLKLSRKKTVKSGSPNKLKKRINQKKH